MNKDYPECSGDPACCPENEGHGCCHLSRKSEKPAVVSEGLKLCPFPKTVYLASPHIQQSINGYEQTIGMFLTDKPVGGYAYEYTRVSDELIDKLVEALQFYARADYHFDAFSSGAKELFHDNGDIATEALALADKWRKG